VCHDHFQKVASSSYRHHSDLELLLLIVDAYFSIATISHPLTHFYQTLAATFS
jgi:hypothetical protein